MATMTDLNNNEETAWVDYSKRRAARERLTGAGVVRSRLRHAGGMYSCEAWEKMLVAACTLAFAALMVVCTWQFVLLPVAQATVQVAASAYHVATADWASLQDAGASGLTGQAPDNLTNTTYTDLVYEYLSSASSALQLSADYTADVAWGGGDDIVALWAKTESLRTATAAEL